MNTASWTDCIKVETNYIIENERGADKEYPRSPVNFYLASILRSLDTTSWTDCIKVETNFIIEDKRGIDTENPRSIVHSYSDSILK